MNQGMKMVDKMLAYGYNWESEEEFPDVLREASLLCTRQELDELIQFLQDIRSEWNQVDAAEGDHWHFRDWKEAWSQKESDFIVLLTEHKRRQDK